MSLTFLKNLFSHKPSFSEKDSSLLENGKYEPCNQLSDLESAASEPSDASTFSDSEPKEKKGFKVDARVVSDAIIGLSDGLTVPFALTAGLSALGNTNVVIYGGLAELSAGAISMGLGGYLGAKSEEHSYRVTLQETRDQIATSPSTIASSLSSIFAPYDLPSRTIADVTTHLSNSPRLVDFLLHFQHTLPKPAGSRAITCALTIALGYFIGGFVPLLPYFFVSTNQVNLALCWSIAIMAVALFVFGYTKTCFVAGWRGSANVWQGVVGGAQMVVVGSVAAGAAMGLVKAFSSGAKG